MSFCLGGCLGIEEKKKEAEEGEECTFIEVILLAGVGTCLLLLVGIHAVSVPSGRIVGYR